MLGLEESYYPVIELGVCPEIYVNDEGEVTLEYREGWHFHNDRAGGIISTDEGAVRTQLVALMPEYRDSLDVINDESGLVVSVFVGKNTDYGDEWDVINNHWDFIATILNVTDPGTFNSPYLFDMPGVVSYIEPFNNNNEMSI